MAHAIMDVLAEVMTAAEAAEMWGKDPLYGTAGVQRVSKIPAALSA